MGAVYMRDECDVDARYEESVQREIDDEREAREKADERVRDMGWWRESFGTDLEANAAEALAECMANLDKACNGEPASRDAILRALSLLQKRAKQDAYDCARLGL